VAFYVLYFLNQDRPQGLLPASVYEFIADKENGFVTFFISDKRLESMIDDVLKTVVIHRKTKNAKLYLKTLAD
jgi:hypothetical protein